MQHHVTASFMFDRGLFLFATRITDHCWWIVDWRILPFFDALLILLQCEERGLWSLYLSPLTIRNSMKGVSTIKYQDYVIYISYHIYTVLAWTISHNVLYTLHNGYLGYFAQYRFDPKLGTCQTGSVCDSLPAVAGSCRSRAMADNSTTKLQLLIGNTMFSFHMTYEMIAKEHFPWVEYSWNICMSTSVFSLQYRKLSDTVKTFRFGLGLANQCTNQTLAAMFVPSSLLLKGQRLVDICKCLCIYDFDASLHVFLKDCFVLKYEWMLHQKWHQKWYYELGIYYNDLWCILKINLAIPIILQLFTCRIMYTSFTVNIA